MYSTLAARTGGEVRLASPLAARGVNLVLDATGTVAVSQLTGFTSGRWNFGNESDVHAVDRREHDEV